MEEIKILPLNVAIKVVTIDGKKMTKSMFNQIEQRFFFDKEINFKGDGLIGFIKEKTHRYLLWTQNGILRRTNLSPYYNLKKSNRYILLTDVAWFCRLIRIDCNWSDDPRATLDDCVNDLKEYDKKIDRVFNFLNKIDDSMQLFL